MNRVDKINEYGIKEVPDVFICDEEGNVLYYSRTLEKIEFIPKTHKKKWKCLFTAALGNIEDWYNIPYDDKIKTFYFRTCKRNKFTGEDEPLCFAISPSEIFPQSFSLPSDGEPIVYPVIFDFKPEDLLWIEDEDCPNYKISFEKKDSFTFEEIVFSKPERTIKKIKIDNRKKELERIKCKLKT